MTKIMPRILSVLFSVLWFCGPVSGWDITPKEKAQAKEWIQQHFLSDTAQLPFSFVYGDTLASDLLAGVKRTLTRKTIDQQRTQHVITFAEPKTSLRLRCEIIEYHDYPAVEWILHFENTGSVNTPILKNVQASDFVFSAGATGPFTLYHGEGSDQRITDFQPFQEVLNPGDTKTLSAYGGRPSDGSLPFFNIAGPEGSGLVMAIGWTGQWQVAFNAEASGLRIAAGMENTHLVLRPGEKIRTPSILMAFWSGDRYKGHNLLRRILLDHYSPTPAGQRVVPPIAVSVHSMYSFDGQTNEANMVDFIEKVAQAQLPVDYLWIDAGWYESTPPNKWVYTGSWQPDARRFPAGLAPVGTAAHEHGLQFILWFEPERVMRDSWLHKNHPDWILAPAPDIPADQRYQLNDGFFLFNLGHPQALAWTKATFAKMIRDYGVDVYRQDFNIHPLPHWRHGEPADRQGINEIKHVMGLYEFWDTLQREFPNLLIDNCASGGRRIDLEMVRRSVALFRSDECWKPIPEQGMNYGLSLWLPLHGMGSISVNPYDFWSGIGTNFTVALNMNDTEVVKAMKKLLLQYRSIQHLLFGDFYPLTDYSLDDTAWMAWQYNRPELGEGLIQAFRRPNAPDEARTFVLKDIDPQAQYELMRLGSRNKRRLSGKELLQQGLAVVISEQPGVAVIKFSKQ